MYALQVNAYFKSIKLPWGLLKPFKIKFSKEKRGKIYFLLQPFIIGTRSWHGFEHFFEEEDGVIFFVY